MTSNIIPWWIKIIFKITLSRLPLTYAFWQKLGIFRHGEMDNSTYSIDVFEMHVSKFGLVNNLDGKILLELGPGDGISTAIIAACYGAKVILLDVGNFIRSDVSPYKLLTKVLEKKGLTVPNLTSVVTTDDILAICNAKYLTNGLQSLKMIETASIDFIFSQAVLEHVRKYEFASTLNECYRVLKPMGICSHQVDLRDHLGGALNNLRFSEKLWESKFFVKSGFYTNRINYNNILQIFKKSGFDVESSTISKWSTLPTPRNKMSKEFRIIPEDELLVSVFDILAKKKY